MGSPPAPLIANGWLSTYDDDIKDTALIYSRYMDDVLRDIKPDRIDGKLNEINQYHPFLKFTIERENNNNELPFLDMLLTRVGTKVSSKWYTKPTDTGLVMNYHSLAPAKYKRSVVTGMVHRIFRASSSWENFDSGIIKAKSILRKNQYPPNFYEPLIEKTITKIVKPPEVQNESKTNDGEKEEKLEDKLMFIEYRGKVSEKFEQSLKKCNAPVKIIFTLRKLKSSMPSLKPPVEKKLKSGIVYRIVCPCCKACYVGYTTRHALTRLKEHQQEKKPVGKHLIQCNTTITIDDMTILAKTIKSITHLMTLEALFIKEYKPSLNTKDEFKRRVLTIKI